MTKKEVLRRLRSQADTTKFIGDEFSKYKSESVQRMSSAAYGMVEGLKLAIELVEQIDES